MDLVVAKNIFQLANGNLTGKKYAKLAITDTSTVDIV